MYDLRKIAEFIELRAHGLSYDACQRKLNVSKRTLNSWGSLYAQQIGLRKKELFEELQERYKVGDLDRIGHLARQHTLIRQELVGRDFSALSTEKLLNLHIRVDKRLSDEATKIEKELESSRPANGTSDPSMFIYDYSGDSESGVGRQLASGSVITDSQASCAASGSLLG